MLSQLKSEDASPPVGSLKCNTVLPTKRWFWDRETKQKYILISILTKI
jgi:hypothetical protein